MIGYHVTDARNWPSIQEYGLIPYPINKPKITDGLPTDQGIWVWDIRPSGDKAHGQAIFLMSKHRTKGLVLLEVRYTRKDVLIGTSVGYRLNGATVRYTDGHYGTLNTVNGDWDWHDGEPYTILKNPIKPRRITLLETWDLEMRQVPVGWLQRLRLLA